MKHVKTYGKTEIDGVVYKLDLKTFTTDDGKEIEFLSLVKGREIQEGDEKIFEPIKRYTIPVKCKDWLGEVLSKK